MRLLIIALILLVSQLATATDKFNTLMWNRENFEKGNGKVDTQPWYEWWYYKVVLPATGESFYFMYGVVNPWDSAHSLPGTRACVEVGDFNSRKIASQCLPVNRFSASYKQTLIMVGKNLATDRKIQAEFTNEASQPVSWNIDIKPQWSFNAMGWAISQYDLLNIFWYPVQADALFSGTLTVNGKTYEFKNAPGYQDRNWGTTFPPWWTWIVANYFPDSPGTALAIGGGNPTLAGQIDSVEGVAIGLYHKGKVYHWRPNDFDIVNVDVSFGKWHVSAIGPNYKIEVIADAPVTSFMDLQFTTPTGEVFHDYETLSGSVDCYLYERTVGGWKLLEKLHSPYAGIEFGSYQSYSASH